MSTIYLLKGQFYEESFSSSGGLKLILATIIIWIGEDTY